MIFEVNLDYFSQGNVATLIHTTKAVRYRMKHFMHVGVGIFDISWHCWQSYVVIE